MVDVIHQLLYWNYYAARYALEKILPEYKEIMDSVEGEREGDATGGDSSASTAMLNEKAMEVFASVSVTDKHVHALSQSAQHASPSPYAMLTECLNRNCVPESDLQANMTSLGRNRHYFEMAVGVTQVKVGFCHSQLGLVISSKMRNDKKQHMLHSSASCQLLTEQIAHFSMHQQPLVDIVPVRWLL